MNDKSGSLQYNVSCALYVLQLIFPYYRIAITPIAILFKDSELDVVQGSINETNFLAFKQILVSMFCLERTSAETYNV
jgi:hypothetical protein